MLNVSYVITDVKYFEKVSVLPLTSGKIDLFDLNTRISHFYFHLLAI